MAAARPNITKSLLANEGKGLCCLYLSWTAHFIMHGQDVDTAVRQDIDAIDCACFMQCIGLHSTGDAMAM